MTAADAACVTRVEHIMGMPIVVDVRDADDRLALDPLFDWFRFVDATFSTYIPDSDINKLNRGEIAMADAHPTSGKCWSTARTPLRNKRILRCQRPRSAPHRPIRFRQRVVGRWCCRDRRSDRLVELRHQRGRRHAPPRRRDLSRFGESASSILESHSGRRVVCGDDFAVATSGA